MRRNIRCRRSRRNLYLSYKRRALRYFVLSAVCDFELPFSKSPSTDASIGMMRTPALFMLSGCSLPFSSALVLMTLQPMLLVPMSRPKKCFEAILSVIGSYIWTTETRQTHETPPLQATITAKGKAVCNAPIWHKGNLFPAKQQDKTQNKANLSPNRISQPGICFLFRF